MWRPASIPVLVDDVVVVAESSIIVEYLDRRGEVAVGDAIPHSRLQCCVGVGGDQRRRVAVSVQTIVGNALRPPDAKDLHGVSQAHATLDLAYATLDRQLTGRDHNGWLAGDDFTLADCAAAPALHYADVLHPLDRDTHPALGAYFDRVLTRPSVARVLEEARPYRELFPLPWPEHVS